MKLLEGMKIQESSTNFMSFLIHDLLDYAQIKSGKFRKNVELFNIHEAVEEIMCIQRQSAIEANLEFVAIFENIADEEFDNRQPGV